MIDRIKFHEGDVLYHWEDYSLEVRGGQWVWIYNDEPLKPWLMASQTQGILDVLTEIVPNV